jgi:uncharacterized protein
MILIDAGPLVALLHADDHHHHRCKETLRSLSEPLVSVWPAITEAMSLLGFSWEGQDALWQFLGRGAVTVLPLADGDLARMRELMKKYRDLPMDLADAAIVRVAEREGISRIFTLDRRDFSRYRPEAWRHLSCCPIRDSTGVSRPHVANTPAERRIAMCVVCVRNQMPSQRTASRARVHRRVVAQMKEVIHRNDQAVEAGAKQLPLCGQLWPVHGVGPLTAVAFVRTIDESHRHPQPRGRAYLGLAPVSRRSGNSEPQRRISKRGSTLMRQLLVQHHVRRAHDWRKTPVPRARVACERKATRHQSID